ncbi:hypothetical protein [Sphingomonas lenta]|uniref:Uncharacterized protein n=1 Tax=Sphingomonas lenta TaxID=1141887 RepID=A0A2A2SDI0_9SPHN|nr:hypothetical protein [Sphingomonas lenta]PAX07309.1 hypothetical protein CKY28_14925 [Sphingomonas lenta]
MSDRIVAVGLLTARDLEMLGTGFRRAFPIDPDAQFDDLLAAIDRAVERGDTEGAIRAASGRHDRA